MNESEQNEALTALLETQNEVQECELQFLKGEVEPEELYRTIGSFLAQCEELLPSVDDCEQAFRLQDIAAFWHSQLTTYRRQEERSRASAVEEAASGLVLHERPPVSAIVDSLFRGHRHRVPRAALMDADNLRDRKLFEALCEEAGVDVDRLVKAIDDEGEVR